VPLHYRLGDEQLRALVAHHPGALTVADPGQLDRVRAFGVQAMTLDEWLDVTAELASSRAPRPASWCAARPSPASPATSRRRSDP